MDAARARELSALYRTELMEHVVPYWERHAPDAECGGSFSCFDRDWRIYDTTKYAWIQGRFAWTMGRLYNYVEPRPEWLDACKRNLDFIAASFFDAEGRMYWGVTREGNRLYKPWGIFSECFAVYALCQYARASGDAEAASEAHRLFERILELIEEPDLDSLSYPELPRPQIHAVPMIILNLSQELREVSSDPLYDRVADEMLDRILHRHMHPEQRALYEVVFPDGGLVDSPDGRVLNPGHALESAWFILQEARLRGDSSLVNSAVQIIEWALERGWDEQYGGILYFLDAEGFPSPYLEWDMKLWWVHVEAMVALLMAHQMTGRADLLEWFERVHGWAWDRFRDPEHGEWFGYLNRGGDVSLTLKGSMWKGFFHLPRALMLMAEMLEEMCDVS